MFFFNSNPNYTHIINTIQKLQFIQIFQYKIPKFKLPATSIRNQSDTKIHYT